MKVIIFLIAGVFLIAGCTQGGLHNGADTTPTDSDVGDRAPDTTLETDTSDAGTPAEIQDSDVPDVLESEIHFVLSKDGIPAILEPDFEPVTQATWNDADLILVANHNGEVKGYPYNILALHEIANDEVGGKKIAVTYCPLCGSGLGFERVIEGETVRFGVSGKLYMNNLVMYDLESDSYWTQGGGYGIKGKHKGKRLTRFPLEVMSYGLFKEKFPDALILSRNVGLLVAGRTPYAPNRYDVDPYLLSGYYQSRELGIHGQRTYDTRLDPKHWVGGIALDGEARAYPLDTTPNVLNDSVGSVDVVVHTDAENNFAIAYKRQVDGRTLTFDESETDDLMTDQETGTTWSILTGEAVEGELQGKTLEKVVVENFFWFSWAEFNPNTSLYGVD